MATVNTCDIPGCTAQARKVRVSIDTENNEGNPTGVAFEMDACDLHRADCYINLLGQCTAAIEAAIK